MFLTYRYRLLPTKRQHRALEAILESQLQLYNAALEERIDVYRKRGIRRSYIDQTKALTEWRRCDRDAAGGQLTVKVHSKRTRHALELDTAGAHRYVDAGLNSRKPKLLNQPFPRSGIAEPGRARKRRARKAHI